jgi:hypothetical protein
MFSSCDNVIFPAVGDLLAAHASSRVSAVTVPPTKLAKASTKLSTMGASTDDEVFVGKPTV